MIYKQKFLYTPRVIENYSPLALNPLSQYRIVLQDVLNDICAKRFAFSHVYYMNKKR